MQSQTAKAAMSAYSRGIIWRNKYMSLIYKMGIYKTCNDIETRAGTIITKQSSPIKTNGNENLKMHHWQHSAEFATKTFAASARFNMS